MPMGNNSGIITSITGGKFNDYRLTLTSGTPVTTADVTNASTVYVTPYTGDLLSLNYNSAWLTFTPGELAVDISAAVNGKPYDIFAYFNGVSVATEILVWTDDTTRATALALTNGVLTKSGDPSRVWMGSFYTSGAGVTEDSESNRYISSAGNMVYKASSIHDATATWNYTTNSWRIANNNTANRVNFMVGNPTFTVSASILGLAQNTVGGNVYTAVTVGYDSTVARASDGGGPNMAAPAGVTIGMSSSFNTLPVAGKHYVAWLESSLAVGTTTWYGGASTGLFVNVPC